MNLSLYAFNRKKYFTTRFALDTENTEKNGGMNVRSKSQRRWDSSALY